MTLARTPVKSITRSDLLAINKIDLRCKKRSANHALHRAEGRAAGAGPK
jgi:hypothetical protein